MDMQITSTKKISLTLLGLLGGLAVSQAADPNYWSWSPTPPMGWNSWDCYGAGVWESNVVANADYMDKNLKSHGWNLVTIDIQWYEPLAHTDRYRRGAWVQMDEYGRLLPALNRFPMTAETHSFKAMGDYLHAKGLKFGLHLMRGIPRQAVDNTNGTPILGTSYKAADIADKAHSGFWNQDMYGVDMTKPGAQEYYDSVFALMASWGLDLVKVDDLAGHHAEIAAIRQAIDKCGRPILLSISMGSGPNDGAFLETNANQWRISFDFWDNWPALYNQFGNLNGHQPFQGPGHWPDADMIPFGHLQVWKTDPPHLTLFTKDEQTTVMTLWSIARSPLILGAELPDNDAFTLSLLTNDEVIAVNQASLNNHQVYSISNHVAWVADVPNSKDKYVALFNTSPPPPPGSGRRRGGFGGPPGGAPGTNAPTTNAPVTAAPGTNAPVVVDPAAKLPAEVSLTLADIGITGSVTVRDLWNQKDLGSATGAVSEMVNSHGAVLLRIHPEN
jgi:hypothetical protein